MRFFILLFCLFIFVARANTNILNQQRICILLGNDLMGKCVENEGDFEECLKLYTGYLACINQLNKPLVVEYLRAIDNYKNNEFSPCGYEISHLILHNKCY